MKLGSYTFDWTPDQYTIPKQDKYSSYVLTYSSVDFFSWGLDIVGKIIELDWESLSTDQFNRIQVLLEDDETKTWDIESEDRIFYGSPSENTPFTAGKTVTGQTSGAIATISAVDTTRYNIALSSIVGTFQTGEVIKDNTLAPNQKSATITSLEIISNFTVNLISWTGTYFEQLNTGLTYRKDCKLRLLIMAEL